MFDGVIEEGFAEDAELFGVVGDVKLVVGEVALGGFEMVGGEEFGDLFGTASGGIDEHHFLAEDVLDVGREQGVVSAREEKRVDGFGAQGA